MAECKAGPSWAVSIMSTSGPHDILPPHDLTDNGSGTELVIADGPAEIPAVPTVVLQTSVREAGANKHWLLDREQVLSRATNLVEADLEDPCKYLLLFVIARASQEPP